MAQAAQGDTVKVHYTGKLDDGTVFDSSADRDPIEFTIGEGRIIPGFEQAVVGMSPGESKTADIQPEQAYGPRVDEMIVEIDRSELPAGLEPRVGQRLTMRSQDGETLAVSVTAASESSVTLDGNHPLAGKALTFDIELLEII